MTGLVFVVLSVAVLATMWVLAGRVYPTKATPCRRCEGTGLDRGFDLEGDPYATLQDRKCVVCSGTGRTR